MTNYFRNSVKLDEYVSLGKKILDTSIRIFLAGTLAFGCYWGIGELAKNVKKGIEKSNRKDGLVGQIMDIAAGEDKILTIKEGIKLARNLGYEEIIRESDSKKPIYLCKNCFRLHGEGISGLKISEEKMQGYILKHGGQK